MYLIHKYCLFLFNGTCVYTLPLDDALGGLGLGGGVFSLFTGDLEVALLTLFICYGLMFPLVSSLRLPNEPKLIKLLISEGL